MQEATVLLTLQGLVGHDPCPQLIGIGKIKYTSSTQYALQESYSEL